MLIGSEKDQASYLPKHGTFGLTVMPELHPNRHLRNDDSIPMSESYLRKDKIGRSA